MSWQQQLARFGALFRRPKPVDDLEEEIRSHLEMEEQENLESGMPPEEAHYAALRRFGNVILAEERSREMWGWNSVETLGQDLRFGLRMLVKNSGLSAVAVMTLALGIGSTTAIFSVIEAVLLHPPPYQNPAQLVEIGSRNPEHEEESVSVGDFSDWQEHTLAVQDIAAYQEWKFQTLAGAGEPDEVWASPVSTNLFHLLGDCGPRTYLCPEREQVRSAKL